MRTGRPDAGGASFDVDFRARSEAVGGVGERLDFDFSAYPPRARYPSDGDVSVGRLRAPAGAGVWGWRTAARGALPRAGTRARMPAAGAAWTRRHAAAAQTISKVARIPRLTAATLISARMD